MTRYFLFACTCVVTLLVGAFAADGQWIVFAVLMVTMWLPWFLATLLANRLYWLEEARAAA